MKFAYRLLKHLIIFLLICLPLQLLGSIILLIFLPFSRAAQLPRILRWFDCADFYIGRDTSTYLKVIEQGYWARYCCLAWRNPINYFDYIHLGLLYKNSIVCNYFKSIPEGVDIGDGTNGGYREIELIVDGKTYYEYYYIGPYSVFGRHFCIRLRIGWKIKDLDNKFGTISQWCFVFNPFHPYTGK